MIAIVYNKKLRSDEETSILSMKGEPQWKK